MTKSSYSNTLHQSLTRETITRPSILDLEGVLREEWFKRDPDRIMCHVEIRVQNMSSATWNPRNKLNTRSKGVRGMRHTNDPSVSMDTVVCLLLTRTLPTNFIIDCWQLVVQLRRREGKNSETSQRFWSVESRKFSFALVRWHWMMPFYSHEPKYHLRTIMRQAGRRMDSLPSSKYNVSRFMFGNGHLSR